VIGSTRSHAVCTAIRVAVKPALESAMKNDQVYGSMRKTIFNYVARDSDQAKDLRIVQMDKEIADLVKSTDSLKDATESYAFRPAPSTSPEEAATLKNVQAKLKSLLAAQKVQLDALSGFVETERARRFGTLDESQQAMQSATAPTGNVGSTPSPVTGFLNDSSQSVIAQHDTPTGLFGANRLDRDLGDIAATTTHSEQAATKAIIQAVGLCRP
jgi:hypothetical protein